ncbi:MAG: hypothetical protein F6J93_15275 [Oscillatoria sp. SIO1A7]|nr:hypothetical protein [Oscillatoria sp. SIO1A7]
MSNSCEVATGEASQYGSSRCDRRDCRRDAVAPTYPIAYYTYLRNAILAIYLRT